MAVIDLVKIQLEKAIYRLKGILYSSETNINGNNEYCIGITTFVKRYNIFYKNLIKLIIFIFPDKKIIVAVNGDLDVKKQERYLKKIKEFNDKFENVISIFYKEPQSLSKLWNQIILKANAKRVLILNDDLAITPEFRKNFENCGILNENLAMINNSFSHFIISKKIIRDVGWFDERFKEIGGEDDDFCVRACIKGYSLPKSYTLSGIKNFSYKHSNNSYGVDMDEVRYSNLNNIFLNEKWEIKDNYFEGSVYGRSCKYWKLKKGMETHEYYGI